MSGTSPLPPGSTATFTATARYASGAARDVSKEVQWISSNEDVVMVAPGGVVTARALGEAFVSFRLADRPSSLQPVLVLDANTFRLGGVLTTPGNPPDRIFGARIEVLSGPGMGRVATSDGTGGYRLFGVSDDASIRITKEGYEPAVVAAGSATYQSNPHYRSLNVVMTRTSPRPRFSGHYTLTLTANCPPDSTLPEALRERRYKAELVDVDTGRAELRLSGAEFFTTHVWRTINGGGDRIFTWTNDEWLRFIMQDSWDWGIFPSVVELLPDARSLVIVGNVDALPFAGGFKGIFEGSFYTARGDNFWSPLETCKSSAHSFVLSR